MLFASAIVPVYNSAKYLNSSLHSMLEQTIQDYELILVDDGSADDSSLMCDSAAFRTERIITCHKRNSGPSSARNIGMDCATGKYIAFWDSDDYVVPTFLSTMTDSMEDKSVMALCGFDYLQGANHESKTVHTFAGEEKQMECGRFYELTDGWLYNMLWNKLFIRQNLEINRIRFDNRIKIGEDIVFISNYLQQSDGTIEIVYESLYAYIERNSSITHIESKADIISLEKQYNAIKGYLLAKNEYNNCKSILSNRFACAYIQKLWEFFADHKKEEAHHLINDSIFRSCMCATSSDLMNPLLRIILRSESMIAMNIYFNLIIKKRYAK